MPDEPDEISRLLRLKRYEQPPPEYFENFLAEFHRRQRAELLREPLWRIAVERIAAFFSEHAAGRYAYAAATALVLFAATIVSLNIVNSSRDAQREPAIAQARNAAPEHSRQVASAGLSLDPRPQIRLPDLNDFSTLSRQTAHSANAFTHPRYVMDTRPVSYEPASSF
jgi:hypothetical protein